MDKNQLSSKLLLSHHNEFISHVMTKLGAGITSMETTTFGKVVFFIKQLVLKAFIMLDVAIQKWFITDFRK